MSCVRAKPRPPRGGGVARGVKCGPGRATGCPPARCHGRGSRLRPPARLAATPRRPLGRGRRILWVRGSRAGRVVAIRAHHTAAAPALPCSAPPVPVNGHVSSGPWGRGSVRPQEPVVPNAPEGTGPPGRPGTAGPSDWSGVAAAVRALRASVPRLWGRGGGGEVVTERACSLLPCRFLHLAAPDGRGCPETETVNGGAEPPGGAAEPSQGGAALASPGEPRGANTGSWRRAGCPVSPPGQAWRSYSPRACVRCGRRIQRDATVA